MSKDKGVFRLEHVSFKFTAHDYFFKDISLVLATSKHYFVRGKNGVGKSTFFRIIEGAIQKNEYCSGRLHIHELSFDLSNSGCHSKYVRLVHQNIDTMLVDQFTVRENLQCAILAQFPGLHVLPKARGADLLDLYGIGQQQQVTLLSGGQRQILAIVMALQRVTHVLLLDEPTASLDYENANRVMECIQKIAQEQNLAVFIISHDVDLVEKYASNGSIIIEEDQGIRFVRYINSSLIL